MPAGDRPFPIPNLAQARQKSSMAHQILVKFKEQGLEENYDEDLAKLCTLKLPKMILGISSVTVWPIYVRSLNTWLGIFKVSRTQSSV